MRGRDLLAMDRKKDGSDEAGRSRSRSSHTDEEGSTVSSAKEEKIDNSPISVESFKRPVTVGVRYYNYEAFMSRRSGDDEDYVIEVLVAKSNLEDEFLTEKSRRDTMGNERRTPRTSTKEEEFGDNWRLQRVRIRSQTILSHLSDLMESSDAAKQSLVFCRPFRVFWHYYDGMKQRMADLEAEVKSKMPSEHHVENDVSPDEGNLVPVGDSMATEIPSVSPETALEHMRIYVQFVEEKILPLYLQHPEPRSTSHKIRYEDIPILFKPGELVFYQRDPPDGKTLHRSAAQQVWRMGECLAMDHPHSSRVSATRWKIYYLDFNGEKIVPIWYEVSFGYFSGEKDITELKCFPLQFHRNHKSILEEQKEIGLNFKRAIRDNVQLYSGWTFVTGILAEALEDEKGSTINYPEYIESDIVIDFKETIRTFPKWETDSDGSRNAYSWGYDPTEIDPWVYSDDPAAPPTYCEETMLTREDTLYGIEARRYSSEDAFLQQDSDLNEYTWKDEDLALLPKRIFGYVLRERRFSRLDVRCIHWGNNQDKITLDNIEMNDGHRNIIRSAVSSHFKAQQQEKELNISTFNLDAIRGKGKGLTILLHGAPGVGKTATAEAVAIENNKPLFPITCGDLGTKPEVVDKTLRDIFRYAHQWECILLFDEADVFLTQRERNSLERNALVGVFLRVLEYYRGVLFLTTNRVGSLDEAFRSRVHVSLWYPHLTADHTISILRNSLKRLPQPPAPNGKPVYGLIKVMYDEIEDFVRDEYRKYSRAIGRERGPWNGRQIRNAVQIAACLALYQKETASTKDDYPAVLTARHFQSVAETTSEFEGFLKKTRIGDDSYWAQQRHDRADDWDDASDHGDNDYQYEVEDITPARRPARLADERLSDRDSGITRQLAQPTGRRGSPQSGGAFSARRAAPQSSARSSRHAAPRSYDYGDDRSDGYDYDDAAPAIAESRSSRRPPTSASSPRIKAAPPEHSGKTSRRRYPADIQDLEDSRDILSEEEGHLGEWVPDENSRSRMTPSTPSNPLRRREARDDEAQLVSPRRDNRAGGGYGGDRRQRGYD
ncbi:hypothetical protein F5X98DRAFT_347984 [Xylaria grammica]|nr:hypothetical protein F5X98DRAFT_347984 [Xylaria grammica]